MNDEIGLLFVRAANQYLTDSFWPRLSLALEKMSDEDLWWRPNEASNSAGNLVLHLCGNARQWIVAGVGGGPDTRDRAAEFARRDGIGRGELLSLLRETVADVDATLAELDHSLDADAEAPLQRRCRPQGFDQTVLDAVFHVVEHFSYHTGQIVLLAKWHAGERIQLYDDARLNDGSGGS